MGVLRSGFVGVKYLASVDDTASDRGWKDAMPMDGERRV
jgi:hypothetical protein